MGVSDLRTLTLALPDDILCHTLEREMQKEYAIAICHNGEDALAQLQAQQPDVLVLDLGLTLLDGLQVLRMLGDRRPEIILALTTSPSARTYQMAMDLGVDALLSKPCRPLAIMQNIAHLLDLQQRGSYAADPQSRITQHLNALISARHRDGFQHLRVGLPIFCNDPTIGVNKVLYPAIAELCGNKDGKQVEHSIRELVHHSWDKRNVAIWKRYFPHHTKCPSNKEFFSNLARVLEEEEYL